NRQIDVEVGPVKMISARPFDIHDLRNCGVGEPREGFERQENLPIAKPQPKTVARDVRDFNVRSDVATLFEFVAHEIESLPQYGLVRAAEFRDSPPVRWLVPSKTSPSPSDDA